MEKESDTSLLKKKFIGKGLRRVPGQYLKKGGYHVSFYEALGCTTIGCDSVPYFNGGLPCNIRYLSTQFS